MSQTRSQPAYHPSLFDPLPTQPQWEDLPLAIQQQLTPLLVQLLKQHAARKRVIAEKGGADE